MTMAISKKIQQEEHAPQRPGRKKKDNKIPTVPATFKLTSEIIERLGHYVVNRTRVESQNITKSEIVEKALDEFLKLKGF